MTLRDALATLPDEATVPVSWVRQLLEEPEDGPRYVSTTWLAGHEGRSSRWWADQCRLGLIPGAWQEREASETQPGSPWLLPLREARAHLLRTLNHQRRSREGVRRGPRKKLQVVREAS